MNIPVVVAEIVRSGFVEGHHYGSIVALSADGEVDWSVGSVDAPILARSCNKPIQALAMVRLGLDLPEELLALTCASHSGEEFHLDGVRRILAGAGLDESALQTPPDYPVDDATREAAIRDGRERDRISMNCSGKHAGMLVTCVVNGWDTATYRDAGPPAPGRDPLDVRGADGGAGRRCGGRRVRGSAAVLLADGARSGLPRPGQGPGRARAAGRGGHPAIPGVGVGDDA